MLPHNGRGQGHVTRFLTLPPIVCLIGDAMHFTFRLLFDTEEY